MPILIGIGLCFASGYLLIASRWPQFRPARSDWLVKLSLASGFGLGIFSVVFFFMRILDATHLFTVDFLVTAVLAGICFLRRSRRRVAFFAIADLETPDWMRRLVRVCFAFSTMAASYALIMRALAHPHGDGWDAFAIWNLHARVLFLGGIHWRDGFSPLISWSHPDYPLLLPSAIAHFWTYLGHDDSAIPAVVGLVFAFSTFGLLVSSLNLLRGPVAAILAGIALASTPFFIEQGSAQYADVPLSFFFLTAFVLRHLYQRCSDKGLGDPPDSLILLVGLSLAFASWTKNEGLLFLVAFLLSVVGSGLATSDEAIRPGSAARPCLAPMMIPISAAVLLIVWFKSSIAPSGDLFSDSAAMAQKIFSPARYWVILQWYAKEFFRYGNWVVPTTILLVALGFLVPHVRIRRDETGLRSSIITLALTLCGYFAIYVITPNDLYWHLRFSLNRLFLQVWPSSVFLFFLFVGLPAPSKSQNEPNSSQNEATC